MEIVCDTNIFYNIGSERVAADEINSGGNLLLATPVNLIEIASNIHEKSHKDRKKAAQAVVSFADGITEDPERHLAHIWNIPVEPLDIDWRDGFKAIADSLNPNQLESGVKDFDEKKIRKLNYNLAGVWKRHHYQDFVDKVEALLDDYCPGYSDARKKGKIKHCDKNQKEHLLEAIKLPEVKRLVLLGTRARAVFHASSPIGSPSEQEIIAAEEALEPYVNIYLMYVYKVGTEYAAKPNDWGDFECFCYAQSGRKIATRDKRWIELAEEIGHGDLIVRY